MKKVIPVVPKKELLTFKFITFYNIIYRNYLKEYVDRNPVSNKTFLKVCMIPKCFF